MKDKDFKIRAYGFGELAQLYSPNISPRSASAKLKRWIYLNKKLLQDLNELGYSSGFRNLTPKMVESIVEYIGEP